MEEKYKEKQLQNSKNKIYSKFLRNQYNLYKASLQEINKEIIELSKKENQIVYQVIDDIILLTDIIEDLKENPETIKIKNFNKNWFIKNRYLLENLIPFLKEIEK